MAQTKNKPIKMQPSEGELGRHAARLMAHFLMKHQQERQQDPGEKLADSTAQVYKFPTTGERNGNK